MGRLLAAIAFAGTLLAQPDPIDNIRKLAAQGRFPQAEAAARTLVTQIDARDHGKDSEELSEALRTLVSTFMHTSKVNDPDEEAIAQRALDVSQRVFSPADLPFIRTRHEVAKFLNKDGDHTRARDMLEQVLAMYEKLRRDTPNPDAETREGMLREIALGWNNFALILKDMDDYAAAKSGFEQALALHSERGREDRELAITLNNLASVLTAMQNLAGALPLYQRALAIYEKAVGPDHPLVAGGLNNLGALLDRMNKPAEAEPLLRRSLAIAEKSYGPDHLRTAHAAGNLANALGALGDTAGARVLEDRVLQIYEHAAGPNHILVANALNGIAVTMGREGKTREAAGFALRSDRISREFLDLTVRGVPEREALLQTAAHASGAESNGLYTALSIALLDPAPETRKAVFDAVIRDRALIFDEMAARKRVTVTAADPMVTDRARDLATARNQLSAMVVKGPAVVTPADFDLARRAKYEAERALAQASATFREQLRGSRTGLDEVAAALAPGDVLIAYTGYRRRPFPTGQPVASYAVFVLRGGETIPALIPIGDVREVDALVAAVRRQLLQEAQSPGRAPKISEAAYRKAAGALRRRIWDPLSAHLSGAKRVFVVPDGSLHLVNLAALPIGEDSYLIEHGPLIHILSSERDLASPAATASGTGLLALGAPVKSEMPGCRGAAKFAELPGTAREIQEIGAIWGRAERYQLTGATATRAAFEISAPGKRVLHLAVHGFFLDKTCAHQPLLLSGISLSGGRENILTAEQIVSLNLDGVEWAVLSACDTGLGDVKTGEGVFGLRRAFQLAGVRTVILSLWPVDDDATREWMASLYRARFLNHRDAAQSARQASLAMLTARRANHLASHPFYWAAFVANGDWR